MRTAERSEKNGMVSVQTAACWLLLIEICVKNAVPGGDYQKK